jgi:hypothetical protein
LSLPARESLDADIVRRISQPRKRVKNAIGFAAMDQPSARVRRDLDVIRRLKQAQVGFTVATDDETVAALFERRASPVAERVF